MVNIERKKLEQVLEALEWNMAYLPTSHDDDGTTMAIEAVTTIKETLAQPEQEQTGIREIRVTETVKPAGPSGDKLSDFQEGQWWVKEIEVAVAKGTLDQKRAFAVVRNFLATYQAHLSAQQGPVAIGCKCSVCGEWQRWTPSGMVCKNGHGGAKGINHRIHTPPPPERKWVDLTDAEIQDCYSTAYKKVQGRRLEIALARTVLAKSKELNT